MHKRKPLKFEDIDALACQPGVRRIAVENFLMTLPLDIPYEGHLANLEMDTRLYKWNLATVKAIREGIDSVYGY